MQNSNFAKLDSWRQEAVNLNGIISYKSGVMPSYEEDFDAYRRLKAGIAMQRLKWR